MEKNRGHFLASCYTTVISDIVKKKGLLLSFSNIIGFSVFSFFSPDNSPKLQQPCQISVLESMGEFEAHTYFMNRMVLTDVRIIRI